MVLTAVRQIRRALEPDLQTVEDFETEVLSGFVLARAASGISDGSIRREVGDLDLMRSWFGRPLWEMEPADADRHFGHALRGLSVSTRYLRSFSLATYFRFIELRMKPELYRLTGCVAECPLDEMNTPRRQSRMGLRIPPEQREVQQLFAGWRNDLVACRKFAPAARNYVASRLMGQVGLRINEVRMLDLADARWELGRFGKLHVRFGKGARRSGPRERMVPLFNGSADLLRWYVEEVWGHFPADHTRPGAPLFPSERRATDGASLRVGDHALRLGLAEAAQRHLPDWHGRMTPHVLRHFCASDLYLNGMDLMAVQELLGHEWLVTTLRYVHVHRGFVEEAWQAGQQRAAARLSGLAT
ncbi:tyrosine-type recombinase/integrase [Streptomyces sp. NPDC060322]|uniref:tyrosine-type recombinase/integrase n=1 Tax=Streptomyces sp. NPDC060322 TaxID=3347097 RepID=UPI00365F397F